MATSKRQVGFRPPDEIRAAMTLLAEKEGRSLNGELVIAAKEHLERKLGKDWPELLKRKEESA